jgi:hypothetical protein
MDVAASVGLALALVVMRLRAGRRVSPGRYLEPLLLAALAASVVFEGPSALLRLSYFLVAFLVASTNEVDPQGTRNRSRWWLPAVLVALCFHFDPGNRAPWDSSPRRVENAPRRGVDPPLDAASPVRDTNCPWSENALCSVCCWLAAPEK